MKLGILRKTHRLTVDCLLKEVSGVAGVAKFFAARRASENQAQDWFDIIVEFVVGVVHELVGNGHEFVTGVVGEGNLAGEP